LFTVDTITRWYRELVAQKYDGSQNRTSPGRPQITEEIVNLVIRFKEENPRWRYQKITDQIVYLGFKISKSTVKSIPGIGHDILDFCVRELGALGGESANVDSARATPPIGAQL